MKSVVNHSHRSRRQTGFSMIEVLVSLVILLVGILGLVGLIVVSQRTETESYQRSQALLLMQDMVGRIKSNRNVAACYAISSDVANAATPYMGVGSAITPACGFGSIPAYTRANSDLVAWGNLLLGASESITIGGVSKNAGAMVGARGCINFDPITSNYMVVVAWQGLAGTAAAVSSLTCGSGLYGNEGLRRVVSTPVTIANLN